MWKTGIHGWLVNALDCKSSGQVSSPGCDWVNKCFSVFPSQHLYRLGVCLAFVCTACTPILHTLKIPRQLLGEKWPSSQRYRNTQIMLHHGRIITMMIVVATNGRRRRLQNSQSCWGHPCAALAASGWLPFVAGSTNLQSLGTWRIACTHTNTHTHTTAIRYSTYMHWKTNHFKNET